MAWHKLILVVWLSAAAYGQQPNLEQILQQLNQLQQDNQRLNREIDGLRQQVLELKSAKPAAPLEEKVAVVSQRVEDLAGSKVEAAEKFPLKISGLVLMNSYMYAGHTGGVDLPMVSVPGADFHSAGGTFRNTQLAFLYNSPKDFLGAEFSGKLQLDFFGGTLNIQNHLARIRNANISLDWASRSLTFAVDKPIFSPRDPDSLSQLGVPAFANSGNLWLWQPQVRYEERVKFNDTTGLRARIGVYQTNETLAAVPANVRISPSRPALQGRFELFHETHSGRRFELAPGFHVSRSLVAGAGVNSYAVSLDWLAPIAPRLDWTGFAFTGQDLTGLGIAGIHQSFNFVPGSVLPVRNRGGWTQLTLHAAKRVDINLIGGMEDDFNRDLPANGVARNLSYAANLRLHLAPNVVLGPEILQIRTTYRQSGILLMNRYDLALGYFF
ncbi:MAG TPA: hypothetical protein VKT29_12815 [Terriglobales bacterium]|nr:hypothetical protein [Terriglobales bacterium]